MSAQSPSDWLPKLPKLVCEPTAEIGECKYYSQKAVDFLADEQKKKAYWYIGGAAVGGLVLGALLAKAW